MKLVALAMLIAFATTVPLHAQDGEDGTASLEDTPHITIVGTATGEAMPDLAIVTLGVKRHEGQAKNAADAVAATARSIVDAAKAMGVAPADLATQSVALQQSFEDVRDAQGRITGTRPSGFDASNTVSIRIRDLGKAGGMVQAMIDKGANSLEGVAFTVERSQSIQDKLDAEAAANARRQAAAIAQAAGAKLGRVLLITRPDAQPAPRGRTFVMARTKTAAPVEMPLEPGTTSFVAQVEITWALEQ